MHQFSSVKTEINKKRARINENLAANISNII